MNRINVYNYLFIFLYLLAMSVAPLKAQEVRTVPILPILQLLFDDEPLMLSSITISGPAQVDENSGAQYTCTAEYSDGSIVNVTNSATWSENSSYTTIDRTGYLSTASVSSGVSSTITANYGGKSDTHNLTIKNTGITTTISITSLPTVDDDGFYTMEWSVTGLAATPWTIQEDSDITFTSPTTYLSYDNTSPYIHTFSNKESGTYCYRIGLSPTGPFSQPRCMTVNIPQVQSITISGSAQVDENSGAQYTCTAEYSDGSIVNVTNSATWSENSSYTTIDRTGYLSTASVSSDVSSRITASYSGKSDTHNLTIKNVPKVATLRIINKTRYDMIDIRLNNIQKISYPNIIPVGSYWDFEFNNSGTLNYYLAVGFYNTSGTRNPWFNLNGTATISIDQITTITFNNPTIGQLLSGFNSSGQDWVGDYWVNLQLNSAKFHFGYNGSWSLYNNNSFLSSGTVTLTSWPNYSSYVIFRLNQNDEITLWHPFANFLFRNGPPDWPLIEYYAQ